MTELAVPNHIAEERKKARDRQEREIAERGRQQREREERQRQIQQRERVVLFQDHLEKELKLFKN